eukprot:scaffold210297_cov32-Tisochrysis_lutea.AAC.1
MGPEARQRGLGAITICASEDSLLYESGRVGEDEGTRDIESASNDILGVLKTQTMAFIEFKIFPKKFLVVRHLDDLMPTGNKMRCRDTLSPATSEMSSLEAKEGAE